MQSNAMLLMIVQALFLFVWTFSYTMFNKQSVKGTGVWHPINGWHSINNTCIFTSSTDTSSCIVFKVILRLWSLCPTYELAGGKVTQTATVPHAEATSKYYCHYQCTCCTSLHYFHQVTSPPKRTHTQTTNSKCSLLALARNVALRIWDHSKSGRKRSRLSVSL